MKDLDYSNIDKQDQVNLEIIANAITALEEKVTSGSGAPSGGNSGDVYVDVSNSRLYANVSGTWKFAVLT